MLTDYVKQIVLKGIGPAESKKRGDFTNYQVKMGCGEKIWRFVQLETVIFWDFEWKIASEKGSLIDLGKAV